MTNEQITRVRELIAALRSGRYQQGRNRLREGDTFCCLGVACDLHNKSDWDNDPDGYRFHDWETLLPNEVKLSLGFRTDCGSFGEEALTSLNDSGKSFPEIADIIENQLETKGDLFVW